MSAEPLFSKENYYRYSSEPARTVIYDTEECKQGDQNDECAGGSDHYLRSYLYYLWHWFWCNIILILIIGIIFWLLFRWWYARRITAEFVAAAARLPVAGDLTVGNAQFMLGTLRNSLPV
jgi:hypothetical protein